MTLTGCNPSLSNPTGGLINKAKICRTFTNVMTIVLGAADYTDVMSDFFLGTFLPAEGMLLSNMHALSSVTQTNYFAMLTGATSGVTSDATFTVTSVSK
jgi:hypothetical protein